MILIYFFINLFFWFVFSGKFSFYNFLIGVLISSSVTFLSRKLCSFINREFSVSSKLLLYLPWLFGQIMLSGMNVLKFIWSKKIINPGFQVINSNLDSSQNFIYANSITLTPGTIAVDLGENTILVHALNRGELESMEGGDMENKIARLC